MWYSGLCWCWFGVPEVDLNTIVWRLLVVDHEVPFSWIVVCHLSRRCKALLLPSQRVWLASTAWDWPAVNETRWRKLAALYLIYILTFCNCNLANKNSPSAIWDVNNFGNGWVNAGCFLLHKWNEKWVENGCKKAAVSFPILCSIFYWPVWILNFRIDLWTTISIYFGI